MAVIEYRGRLLSSSEGENVLDCLERHGEVRAASCRSGVCQSCIMKVTRGAPASPAQQGLKAAWRAQGYFLPCVCVPTEDLAIDDCDATLTVEAEVVEVTSLAPAIVRVRLRPRAPLAFAAGQFVSVIRPEDGLTRPYSIASLPERDVLDLHVAVREGGAMSGWLREAQGRSVKLRGPSGECFYQAGQPDQPLLLAGTGTGLAPLWGVLQSALQAGHRAPIHLYHASRAASGLYLLPTLRSLAEQHSNLHVHGLTESNDVQLSGVREERLEAAIPRDVPGLSGFRVYLSGNPALVQKLKKKAFLAGAKLQEIHSDPFVERTF
jgi:NAD(P)H-flavin reductase/ferredoxin